MKRQQSEQSRDTEVFRAESSDIPCITSLGDFIREFFIESKKLWYLAGPAIFTSLCQYSLGAVTQLLAGHVGTTALAAISVENNVVACFCFGIMKQAFGARKLEMLGVLMQRSWVILNAIALLLSFLYGRHETASIAKVAGVFALWMLPQLFAYSMNFPIQKSLQAQSKIMVMAWISAGVLVAHAVLSWVGGSNGSCKDTWKGFSLQAFQSLCGFIRLSLASAVMLCLEVWYFMVLILFAGYLKNVEISVDAMSICMNILGWTIMFAFGMNAAVSVRLSNEVGASHPRTAKLTIVVAMITSFVVRIWSGMLSRTFLQSCVLSLMVYKTNWSREASLAEIR
ncbi:hypothetical protein AAHE18_15G112900 [Arachis hypogaea]